MANRPVFSVSDERPYYEKRDTEFRFYSGFSEAQKRRSIESLHAAYLCRYPAEKLLEISSRSAEPLGAALSAFRLRVDMGDGETRPLECVFQGAKLFENGGPYVDLLQKTPREAKRDPRLRESGRLLAFRLAGEEFPLVPETFFYDWLYVGAVHTTPGLSEGLFAYTAFTDIEFNPKKSLNCQARSAAIFVSLLRCGRLEEALRSPEAFRRTVYGNV